MAIIKNSYEYFKINDNVLRQEIITEIKTYYKEKSKDEVLSCFIFETDQIINAFDCIIGLQNYCNREYEIIEKSDNEGLSLFFKLYKSLYSFTQDKTQDKTQEKGCTEPLYGKKSKCIIKIVPQEEKGASFQMDKKCIKFKPGNIKPVNI